MHIILQTQVTVVTTTVENRPRKATLLPYYDSSQNTSNICFKTLLLCIMKGVLQDMLHKEDSKINIIAAGL